MQKNPRAFCQKHKFLLFSPSGGEIFRNRPDRPWGPPNLLYNAYRVLPWGKEAGACCWSLTPT